MSLYVIRCCWLVFSIISTVLHTSLSSSVNNSAHNVDSGHKETTVSSQRQESVGKALFWLSPAFNMDIFTYVLPFAFIPLLLIYVYIVYPPGKYYSSAPRPPQYLGHFVDNTPRRSW
ncbi:unnamed protein product [Orchesella dallaii]|uniref:Transmembrane protein n=1 Tax=Orchesella dallaii TaxID=48710 RepID=A0ABP1R1K1_9HEXA